MTAAQSFELYKLFFQITQNEVKAKSLVTEIENTVETRFEIEKPKFIPRNEFEKVEHKIDLFRQEVKNLILESEVKFAARINSLIIWIVSTSLAAVGLIFTLMKLTQS